MSSTKQPRGTISLPAVFVWPAAILLIAIGVCLGILFLTIFRSANHTFVLRESENAEVPTVTIDGYRDGALVGTTHRTRLIVGNTVAVPDGSGAFAIRNSVVSQQTGGVQAAPVGTQFVASKRGKKYYPVGSAGADRLSPANKIYFQSREAAEAAGYTR